MSTTNGPDWHPFVKSHSYLPTTAPSRDPNGFHVCSVPAVTDAAAQSDVETGMVERVEILWMNGPSPVDGLTARIVFPWRPAEFEALARAFVLRFA